MLSRDISKLNPVVYKMATRLLASAEKAGLGLSITSAVRTRAEQAAIFAQGRRPLSEVNGLRSEAGLAPITEAENKIVTRAAVSVHEFGCAFDVALRKDGSVYWDVKADINGNEIPDYEEIGKMGEEAGLKWGGRFGIRDLCHFEHTAGLLMKDLKAGLRPER